MAYCDTCGQKNRPGAHYCRACGAEIPLIDGEFSAPPDGTAGPDASPAAAEPPPPPPRVLKANDFVARRFRVLRSLDSRQAGRPVYQAEDLTVCFHCSARQSLAGMRYCKKCGEELTRWPVVELVESPASEGAPGQPDTFIEDGLTYQVQPAQPEAPAESAAAPRIMAGYETDVGQMRAVNEDSLLVIQMDACSANLPGPRLYIYAVADGVGGSDAGEVASRIAVRALAADLARRVAQPLLDGELLLPESLGEHLRTAVRHANAQILRKRQERGHTMGATLTALVLRGGAGVIANVGDSRTYRFRDGSLSQLTHDHSVVANLIAGGAIRPDEQYTHEQRNIILRSLGERGELEVDLFPVQVQPGDRFLLCSDGLWEMVRTQAIEAVLRKQPDPQKACKRLVQLANEAGGQDNISVVLVDAQAD